MSCEIRTETFEEIQVVRIECCNKMELLSLINGIQSVIKQKLQKLNILIKNCDVYTNGKAILVHDRYGICSDLESVCAAFALDVFLPQTSLRGKVYLISDPLVAALRQLGQEFSYNQTVENALLSDAISKIIDSNAKLVVPNTSILRMVENIMTNGEYVTEKRRTISETYEDYFLTNREESKWVSDEAEVRKSLLELSIKTHDQLEHANENLRDGTAKLIYSRARQMGYTVKEVKHGAQVQLVLTRNE